MNAYEIATEAIKKFEGFVPHPYMDGGGRYTIGYGTTVYPTGHKVTKNDKNITEATATYYLCVHLTGLERELGKMTNWDMLNKNQMAALLSLAYNVGCHDIENGNIAVCLARKEFDKVPNTILQYNKKHVNGKLRVDKGLVNRRKAEVKLYNTPVESV